MNTSIGHQCQDNLLDEQIPAYVDQAAQLGVEQMDAQLMCANFIHQGSLSAAQRILAKTVGGYTLDNIYAACQTDSASGQVGTYRDRQTMVYNALKEYISDGASVTPQDAIQKALSIANAEVGYLEKNSNSNLDSKTDNAGENNYTKYWRDIKPEWQVSPWCACFVTWVFEQAFGQSTTAKLLKHYPYVYVPTLAGLFNNYSDPQVGDIVMFKNSSGVFSHTGLVTSVSGDYFTTVEGNTAPNTGIADNGDGVYAKGYYNSNLPGTKFARPDYSLVSNFNSGGQTNSGESWTATGTAVCSGSSVYVRAEPGGTIIGSLVKGNSFEVDGIISGDWVHIKVAGIGIGYMHKDYVQYSSGSSSSSDSTTTSGKVQAAQHALNNSFGAGIVVDGIWGNASNTAYIMAIQKALNAVYGTGLTVDGIWGENTASAISSHNLKKGDNNSFVGVLQIGLYAHDIALVGGIDYDFGSSTESGVISFQSSEGLSADGVAGRDTFAKLVGKSSSSSTSWNKTETATCSGSSVYVMKN